MITVCLSIYGTGYVWTDNVPDTRIDSESGLPAEAPVIMMDRDDRKFNVTEDRDRMKRLNQTFNSLLNNEKKKFESVADSNDVNIDRLSLKHNTKQQLWNEAVKRVCPEAKSNKTIKMNWLK